MATPRTSLEVAQASEKKGELAKAAEAYQKHLEKNGGDVRALLRLAEVRERLNQPEPAAEAFRRLGERHLKDGRRAKAVSMLTRALKLVPHDCAAAIMLSDLLADDGKKRDAVKTLETTAAATAARGDKLARLELLSRAARLDGGAPANLSVVSALAELGRVDEARALLGEVAGRLREQKSTADEVLVLERLLEFSPGDLATTLAAARGALTLEDARRALTLVRRALDDHRDDPGLTALAAEGLELLGEPAAAALVYRAIARRLSREGAPGAKEAWQKVLRLSPADGEARTAVAPALALDVGELLARRGRALDGLGEAELDGAFAALDAPAPGKSEGQEFEVFLEELKGLTIEADPVLAVPEDLEPAAEPPLLSGAVAEPARAVPGLTAGPAMDEARPVTLPRPAPRRLLVLGVDPEAGWASQALSDLGLDVQVLAADELGTAVERALEGGRDLLVAPAPLAAVLREASEAWQVLSLCCPERAAALDAARAAGLPVVDAVPISSAAELTGALETLGAPLQLGETGGAALEVARGAAPGFQLALARQRFKGELFAQRRVTERVHLLVAADVTRAVVLGEWAERSLEATPVAASPAGEGEEARRELGRALSRALQVRGLAVLTLAKLAGSWAFEAAGTSMGPGALAVEARSGVPVFSLAYDLLCGKPLPPEPAPRGFACAVQLRTDSLTSISSVRIESGLDGTAFVCAHAPEQDQAERRLARVLGAGAKR